MRKNKGTSINRGMYTKYKSSVSSKVEAAGITLVALVITIIVLLILAGVTISLVVGDNGIIGKAKNAKENMTNAQGEENEQLRNLQNYIEELGGNSTETEANQTNGNFDEKTGVNSPKLDGTGLIGVTIDGSGSITPITEGQNNWYSYTSSDRRWANAKTADGSMWVWIPRYAYKIDKTAQSIDVKFLQGTSNKDASGADVTAGGYIVHPCFQNGSNNGYANGEWDKEIEGIWVAKYAAGYAGGNNSASQVDSGLTYGTNSAATNFYGNSTANSTQMKYPVFMPTTYAYNYITISDSYELSKNLTKSGNPYGLVNAKIDSHMMKNSEWGAVAYLTQSIYGRNKEEVTINNVNLNNTPNTIYAVTGMAGASVSAATNTTTIAAVNGGSSGSYRWNEANGQKASSTGNMYGIYDLSGCVWERTAGYINNGNANLESYGTKLINDGGKEASTKYKSVYAYNTSSDTDANNYNQSPNPNRKGEALHETSTSGTGSTAWNGDYSYFPYTSWLFFIRGGNWGDTTGAGAFAFHYVGGGVYSNDGFRAVLVAL